MSSLNVRRRSPTNVSHQCSWKSYLHLSGTIIITLPICLMLRTGCTSQSWLKLSADNGLISIRELNGNGLGRAPGTVCLFMHSGLTLPCLCLTMRHAYLCHTQPCHIPPLLTPTQTGALLWGTGRLNTSPPGSHYAWMPPWIIITATNSTLVLLITRWVFFPALPKYYSTVLLPLLVHLREHPLKVMGISGTLI